MIKMIVYFLAVLLGIAVGDPDCTEMKSTVVKREQNITIISTHHNAAKEYSVHVSFANGTNVPEKSIAQAVCHDNYTCTLGSNDVSGKFEICCDRNSVTLTKMNGSIHDTGIYKIYRFGLSVRKNETCVYSNATVIVPLTSTTPFLTTETINQTDLTEPVNMTNTAKVFTGEGALALGVLGVLVALGVLGVLVTQRARAVIFFRRRCCGPPPDQQHAVPFEMENFLPNADQV